MALVWHSCAKCVFGLGADAEVGVGFGVEDSSVPGEDVRRGDGQAPAWLPVHEGDVDEDGLQVVAVVLGDGVDQAELLGEGAGGVGEDGERQAVLAAHEVALPLGLGADGDQEAASLAKLSVEIAPGLELGNAVGTPAAAKEFNHQGPKCEQIGGADEFAGRVLEGELGGGCADGEDIFFDAGLEELCDSALTHGEALGLNEGAGVGGDLVELVLKCGHCLYSRRLHVG